MKRFYCLMLVLCPYITSAQPPAIKPPVAGDKAHRTSSSAIVNGKSKTIRPPAIDDKVPNITFSPMVNGKSQTILPLAVGDKVPDIPFTQMINHSAPSAKLSQFKGKLVILDFWATWCSGCIKKFNLLDSMQRKYPAQLQVILVNAAGTRDTREKIEKFFNHHKSSTGSRLVLPTAFNDSMASAYFPGTAIPLYCWISPAQKCIAITGPDELTAQNIEAAIKGNAPQFAGLGLMNSFNAAMPLFVQGNAGNGESIKFRSTLSGYIPGMRSAAHTTRNHNDLVTQFKLVNTPLLQLVTRAYWYFGRPDRIQFSVSDTMMAALHPVTGAVKTANTYTYELICPPGKFKQLSVFIQQDIERWFGLTAKFEKKPTPCYGLTIDTVLLGRYRTKGGKRTNHLNDSDNSYTQNCPLLELVEFLDRKLDKPVFQKDSIPFNLDLSLPHVPASHAGTYIAALAAMGIYLTPSKEMIEQFTIYQLPKQQTP